MTKFADLGLTGTMLETIESKGFEVPTSIQKQVIPFLLSDQRDLIGLAQTGTGKTAAFGIPMLELLSPNPKHVEVLVLTPTRELAIQVAEEIHSLKGDRRLNIVPIYGGQSITLQLRQLKKNVSIVVGTPGRIRDHLERKSLKLDKISYLILDEADEMLNMGFLEEVSDIMQQTNPVKRTLLFSATMSRDVRTIAEKYMNQYELLEQDRSTITTPKVDQLYFEVRQGDKFEALCRIIDFEEEFYGLIFCRTKKDVDDLNAHLQERGYDSDGLHGDISQSMRIKILNKLKKRHINILVATDVAARGIDISDLTHVINYSLPHDPESYVHRIGRTGRAGKEGSAITFVTPSEYRRLQFILRKTKADIKKKKLPKIADLIDAKRARIQNHLQELIQAPQEDKYQEMAQKLLEENDAVDITAALLKKAFKKELSSDQYVEINERGVVDQQGKTRLFVGQGKKDKLTKGKLLGFIKDECSIPANKVYDIQILEGFSFISMPFQEAEELLAALQARKTRSPIHIMKAKKDRSRSPRSSSRRPRHHRVSSR